MHACMRAQPLSRVWSFVTPWAEARQAPLSMGFSRQDCWSGLHFLLPGVFPTRGLKPHLLHCQVASLPRIHPGSPYSMLFLELSCLFDDPVMLAIWFLVPLPFLNPAWASGSSQFTYCWSLVWRILSIRYSLWYSLQWWIYPAIHHIRIPQHVMREGTTVWRISCLEGRIFHTLPPT